MLQALPPPAATTTGGGGDRAYNQNFTSAIMANSNTTNNYHSPMTFVTTTTSTTTAANNKSRTSCKQFCPNVFTPNKCQDCFRQKNAHSQEALAQNRACRKVCKCGHLFVAPIDVDFTDPSHRTRRWQRRWFVLYDDGDLTFSVDEQPDTVPQDVVDMHTVHELADAQKTTGQDYSIVLKTPHHEYYIRGTSKEEIRWWYDVLVMYPRSASYTKQQRNYTQKMRSRTLPSNGLSDEQLLALKLCSVADAEASSASSGATLKTDHDKSLLLSEAEAMAGVRAADRVKETAVAVNKAAHSSSNVSHTALVNPRRTSSATTNDQSELLVKSSQPDDERVLVNAYWKSTRNSTGNNSGLPNCLRSSTIDYVDQLKEKRLNIDSNRAWDAPSAAGKAGEPARDTSSPYDMLSRDAKLKLPVKETFRRNSVNSSDSDSLSDEGLEQHSSVESSLTPNTMSDSQSSQRFVFTGLSAKDIEDLKQLQRIMAKKTSSTGSTSSQSSSTSSGGGSQPPPPTRQRSSISLSSKAVAGLSVTAPLPTAKPTSMEVDFHTRPRSPPLNRTAISRVKERARVRSRSKSPVRPERSVTVPSRGYDQRTVAADETVDESKPGNISAVSSKTSEIEDRLQNLRREYMNVSDLQRSHQQRHSEPSLPANFQLNLLPKSTISPEKIFAEQSTQISLDVRHYETMVSNLEKRLLDREQQIRGAAQKQNVNLDKDRQIALLEKRLAKSQNDALRLSQNLEKAEALNESYQKRLHDLANLWATTTKDSPKNTENGDRKHMKDLEKQLSELEQSYDDMAAKKDSVISSLRREIDSLNTQILEMDVKFRQNSAELTAAYTKLGDRKNDQERLQTAAAEVAGLKAKCLKYDEEIASLRIRLENQSTQLKEAVEKQSDEEKEHKGCHATIDALHQEISTLQSRLQTQEKLHAAVVAGHQQRASRTVRRLTDSLSMLPDFAAESGADGSSRGSSESSDRCQRSLQTMEASHIRMIADLKTQHERELESLSRRKDQELAEEAKATKAALEVIQRDYQSKLKTQVHRVMEEAKRVRDEGQQKILVDVRKDIQDLVAQFAVTSPPPTDTPQLKRENERFPITSQKLPADPIRQYPNSASRPADTEFAQSSGTLFRDPNSPRMSPDQRPENPADIDEISSESLSSSSDFHST